MNTGTTSLSVLHHVVIVAALITTEVQAHDPVFGLGPHTLFKGGIEVHVGVHNEKAGDERITQAEMQLKYGITGNWVAGIGIPYVFRSGSGESDSGRGATSFSTKYRFWRDDLPGAQAAAAVMGKVILDNEEIIDHRQLQKDGSDYLVGLTYGYEGRKWYRWASIRHRVNSDALNGVERPNITLLDVVGGIRPTPTEYREPDWVWMLELNGELIEHVNNGSLRELGGNRWFLSPGLMWTYRNFALKAGVQLPIYNDLSGNQKTDDYRALIELEWHL